MSDITIYYNPFCVVSRNALTLIRHAGIEPTVIDYLRMRPSREKLLELLEAMQAPVRALVRVVCRPSETLLELLPVPRLPPFVKEDGSVVVDRGTRRW